MLFSAATSVRQKPDIIKNSEQLYYNRFGLPVPNAKDPITISEPRDSEALAGTGAVNVKHRQQVHAYVVLPFRC